MKKPTQVVILLLVSMLFVLSFAIWNSQKQQEIYEVEIKKLNESLIEFSEGEINQYLYLLKTNPKGLEGVNDSLVQCLEWLREELSTKDVFVLKHFQYYQHYIYKTLLPVGGFRTKGQVDASLIQMTFDTAWTENKFLNQSKKINNIRELLRYINPYIWSGREFWPYRVYFLHEDNFVFYEKDTIEIPLLFFANYHYRIDKYTILPTSNIRQDEEYTYKIKLVTREYEEGMQREKFKLKIRNNIDHTIEDWTIVVPYQLKREVNDLN